MGSDLEYEYKVVAVSKLFREKNIGYAHAIWCAYFMWNSLFNDSGTTYNTGKDDA